MALKLPDMGAVKQWLVRTLAILERPTPAELIASPRGADRVLGIVAYMRNGTFGKRTHVIGNGSL